MAHPAAARRTCPGVDLVRFVCALLVVGIHVYPFGNNGDPVMTELNFLSQIWIGRVSVPFFLVCAGYFLFRGTDREPFPMDKVCQYARKLLRLYLMWNLLYSPLILKEILLVHPDGLGAGMLRFFRDLTLKGSYHHLWYLHAAMVAIVMVGLLRNRGVSVKKMLPFTLGLFLAGLLGQSYFGILMRLRYRVPAVWRLWELYEQIFVTTRNGLFEGFLYIVMGAWIAGWKKPLPLKTAAVGFGISMALALAELLTLRRMNWILGADLYVFQVPCVFFLFALALALPLKDRPLWRHLRHLANITYFTHVWVYKLLAPALAALGLDITMPGIWYLTTAAVTLVLAELLLRLQRKPKLAFLRQLYG